MGDGTDDPKDRLGENPSGLVLGARNWTTDKNGFNERVREIPFTPRRVKAALK